MSWVVAPAPDVRCWWALAPGPASGCYCPHRGRRPALSSLEEFGLPLVGFIIL